MPQMCTKMAIVYDSQGEHELVLDFYSYDLVLKQATDSQGRNRVQGGEPQRKSRTVY